MCEKKGVLLNTKNNLVNVVSVSIEVQKKRGCMLHPTLLDMPNC